MPERLSLSSLPRTASSTAGDVNLPVVDPRELRIGVVHLGVGAFHRAHQAIYTEQAVASTGDPRWGILGVTGRSARVVEQLAPQDGLYGVLTKDTDDRSLHVAGTIRQVLSGTQESEAVRTAIAAPTVTVVTLTITEKGYPRLRAGGLATGTDVVGADVRATRAVLDGTCVPRAGSSVGLLVAGLAARFRENGAALSILSCDNLPGNGAQLRRLVTEMADECGDVTFSDWIRQHVTFPSTMVDRIVPATTEDDREQAERMLGLRDEGLVVAEPFGQWVIEDRFVAARPAWETAGATLTEEVEPYEMAKLRMLNGAHSMLAYLGALHGHRTIAEAVADEPLHDLARSLQQDDALPTLVAPDGMDVSAYGDQILARFRNPHLRHTTVQVAMDGSQKLPVRVVSTARERLRAGAVPEGCALAVAAWMVYVARGRDVHGAALPLDDPMASALRERAAGPASGLVDRMFALREIFDEEIAGDDRFRSAVRRAAESLQRRIV